MNEPKSMWDYAEEEAQERRRQAERDDADPAHQERQRKRKAEEFERGVRLGWWDADGTPIEQPEEPDEEETDEA